MRFVVGTPAGRDVPLGAFSRSVVVDAAYEPAAMLAAARQCLQSGEDLILIVDDAHLLDPLSATPIHQLAVPAGAVRSWSRRRARSSGPLRVGFALRRCSLPPNLEIAERLSVSVRTVDGHLYRIFGKLGIERREQLSGLFAPEH